MDGWSPSTLPPHAKLGLLCLVGLLVVWGALDQRPGVALAAAPLGLSSRTASPHASGGPGPPPALPRPGRRTAAAPLRLLPANHQSVSSFSMGTHADSPRQPVAAVGLAVAVAAASCVAAWAGRRPRAAPALSLRGATEPAGPGLPDGQRVHILYCGSCGYRPRAEALRTAILEAFPRGVDVTMDVTRAGAFEIASEAFEVSVNGRTVHSKFDGMGFVDDAEKLDRILQALRGPAA